MKEKRRSTPLTPEEDRERTRAATRELHEKVQEAKDTARDLVKIMDDAASWLDMTATNLDEQFTRFVNDRMDKAAALIDESDAALQESVDKVSDEINELQQVIRDLEARALGCANQDDVVHKITGFVEKSVNDPAYVQAVADAVMRSHGCTCPPGTHTMDRVAAAVGKPHSPDVRVRVARAGEAPGIYLGDLP